MKATTAASGKGVAAGTGRTDAGPLAYRNPYLTETWAWTYQGAPAKAFEGRPGTKATLTGPRAEAANTTIRPL